MQPSSPTKKLPRLHWCAYKGDIQGILQCITDGCSLHETVSLRNQHGRLVCGITALFLAAQRGQGEIVKLLVNNGASPVQPCFIQGSTELCTPAEVASLNLHFKVSRYIKSAAKARRVEEQVLALDDEDRMSQVSGRLARGLDRARSLRSVSGAAGSMSGGAGQLGRVSRGSRAAGSVDWGGASNHLGSMAGDGPSAEGNDAQRMAAVNFMQNVDLAAFDPDADGQVVYQPPTPAATAGGAARSPPKSPADSVKQLFRRIVSWGSPAAASPGVRARGSSGGGAPASAAAVRPSASTRVRGSSAGGAGPGASYGGAVPAGAMGRAGGMGVDVEAVDPARPDHTKVLQRFLKDLDLASWHPEHEAGPGSSARQPSPGSRRGPSPPRSLRSNVSNVSPTRSRA